ncbi:Carbon-nitrogen hydrolase [Xylographa pallens]|nr:Carbon-nitrogen hydrolase [Xylographa pallens]
MHIATLQFSPVLGQVAQNIARADELLAAANTEGLDLLVLPELAFTGYNFPSLAAITPHLEPTCAGPTAHWAIRTATRLHCAVCVGYPERTTLSPLSPTPLTPPPAASAPLPPSAVPQPTPTHPPNHNALLLASPTGHILAHYRKTHLYYTDTTWAQPGAEGFQAVDLPIPRAEDPGPTRTALGICMDINPHRFVAPWDAFEFATHARAQRCKLVVLSMAWLTRLGRGELGLAAASTPAPPALTKGGTPGTAGEKLPETPAAAEQQEEEASALQLRRRPDADTQAYWVARLEPLIGAREPVVVVCANRCGVEPGDGVESGEGEGEARYAGSSAVLCIGGGRARVGGCLGRGEEGLLRVDTGAAGAWEAGWVLVREGEGEE